LRATRNRLGGALICAVLAASTPAGAQPAPVAESPTRDPRAAARVIFNFDGADLETVLQAASEILGFNYVVEPEARGRKVTVVTPGGVAQSELFRVLLGILEAHGVTAVTAGHLYKIVRIEGAHQRMIPTVVGVDPGPAHEGDEVITQIVLLTSAAAAELSSVLRPLISARGNLLVQEAASLLIITDTAANVRRLLVIVGRLDAPLGRDQLEVIVMRWADAGEVAGTLNTLAARDPRLTSAGERALFVAADRRLNAVIVRGAAAAVAQARRHIEALDVDPAERRGVFLYFPEHARARELAATMTATYAGADGRPAAAPAAVRFVADEVTNAVAVVSSARDWPEIEATLRRLDRTPQQVVIEVLALELNLTDETTFAAAAALKAGPIVAVSVPPALLAKLPQPLPFPSIPKDAIPAGLSALVFDTDRVLTFLNTLAVDNKVSMLSTTKVLVVENKKAVVNVSESVPVLTGAQAAAPAVTSTVTTQRVELKDVGVILTVTPRIGEQGGLLLDLRQELSAVGEREPPPVSSPRFTKREAETSVALRDHQTLVIAGLLRTRRGVERSGVPLLSRIPVIGPLFGAATQSLRKTELLILVTPRILRPSPLPDSARGRQRNE